VKSCPFGCGYRARRHVIDRTPWGYGAMVERVYFDLREHLYREHGVPREELEAYEAARAERG
jgi:hypothetical protein